MPAVPLRASLQVMLVASVVAVTAILPCLVPKVRADASSTVQLLRVPEGGIQPQVAVDAKGGIHLVYFRGTPAHGDLFYVHAEDGGAHFSRPLVINSHPG